MDEQEALAERERVAQHERERAHRVRQIVENPYFCEAIEATRNQLHRDFAKSDFEDDRGRLVARIGIDVLERILTVLTKHMETGKMAEHTLADIGRKRSVLDRFKRAS